MYGAIWNIDLAQRYADRYPHILKRCQQLLGTLDNHEDARRWASVTSIIHDIGLAEAFIRSLTFDAQPLFVFCYRDGFLSALCLHYSNAICEKELGLFLPLLSDRSRTIRIGAMEHLAGMRTPLAVPMFTSALSKATGFERVVAAECLAAIGAISAIPTLENAIQHTGFGTTRSLLQSQLHRLRRMCHNHHDGDG